MKREMLQRKKLLAHSNHTYLYLPKSNFRKYMIALMKNDNRAKKAKRIAKTKMSKMISFYLKKAQEELLEGNVIGIPSSNLQIVRTKDFKMNMNHQNFLKRKKKNPLKLYNLGPLEYKYFIKFSTKERVELKEARALVPFNKHMYKLAKSGKKITEYVGVR